jgi:hypothetical protein
MVLSLAPAMLTLFGHAVWWLPRWLANLLPHVDIEGEAEPPTRGAPVQPQLDGPAAGRTVGRPMPTTDAWPMPPPPIRETTAPGDGDGRGGHVPDD